MESAESERLDPQWVTDLSDGEASFTYSRARSGRNITLYYSVKLTATDRAVLGELQAFFGVGRLYEVAGSTKQSLSKSAVMYRVHRPLELMRVVAHFDAYPLRSEKRKVYEVWREMVVLKQPDKPPCYEILEFNAQRLTTMCVRKQPWR